MFKVCIVGRSNVGKTTIFNALVGRRIGLENDSYNTTRDINEVEIKLNKNKSCLLADTGGNTNIDNEISKHIHQTIKKVIYSTNLVLFVTDARVEPTYYELELVKIVRKAKKPVCLILNKVEGKKELFTYKYTYFFKTEPIFVSAIHRQGIDLIIEYILKEIDNLKEKTELLTIKPSPKKKIKIALVGQTNVGKSLFINRLTNNESTNLVLPTPHTTRDAISHKLNIANYEVDLIDTAGIFRKSKQLHIVDWIAMIKSEEQLHHVDAIIYMNDGSKTITHFDKKIIGMIIEATTPFIICFNKADLFDNEQQKINEYRQELNFFQDFEYGFSSALTGKNVRKIIEKIIFIYERSMHMFDTNVLNFLINSFNYKGQFHMTRNRTRLIKLVQNEKKGNHFTAYFKYTREIHFSIRRQLINHISTSLKMKGIPIKLTIKMIKSNL